MRKLTLKFPAREEVLDHLLELMPNITSLSLPSNFRSGYRFAITNLSQQILKLDFSGSNIEDEALFHCLEKYSAGLEALGLDACSKLSSRAFVAVVGCKKLRHLSICSSQETHFEDLHLEKLIDCAPDVRHLRLSGSSHLTARSIMRLKELKRLRYLSLSACSGVSSEALCVLGEISTLKHLDLTGTQCDDGVFHRLACLKDLRSLSVNFEPFTSQCLAIICENFKKLRRLILGDVRQLTDADGAKFSLLSQLEELQFVNGGGFKDLTFERGLGSSRMTSIKAHGCTGLTACALNKLALRHPYVKILLLHHCYLITDAGIEFLVQRWSRLEVLDLACCLSMTGLRLSLLTDQRPRLTHFHVSG